MARRCKDWIKSYMEFTKQLEAPDNFHLWSAIAVISAVLRRQVWIDFGYFNIYPNVYVALVAPPGKCRKNSAINTASSLLKEVDGIKVYSGAITREALAKEIRNSETSLTLPDGKLYVHSSLAVFAEELVVFVDTDKYPELVKWLVDFYDCKDVWEYKTKHQGSEYVVGVCLTVLGGATPQKLGSKHTMEVIGEGLASRIIFVVEDEVRHRNPLPMLGDYELTLRDNLIADLNDMAKLVGRMKMTDECRDYYVDWYTSLKPASTDERVVGYYERKHVHALKVAMIISASKGSSMVIDVDDFVTAVGLLESIEPNMINAFGATGRSPLTPEVAVVLKAIITRKDGISKKDLFRLVWRDVDPRNFDSIISALLTMGFITFDRDSSGEYIFRANQQKKEGQN